MLPDKYKIDPSCPIDAKTRADIDKKMHEALFDISIITLNSVITAIRKEHLITAKDVEDKVENMKHKMSQRARSELAYDYKFTGKVEPLIIRP